MKTEPNQPINPIDGVNSVNALINGAVGLTKREHFAAMAMQAYLSCPDIGATAYPISRVADMSCEAADALITALNK